MTWIDAILDGCPSPMVVNDSKTPSGVAHVGSLRGVLIHDALARATRRRGMDARFIYGCDDMDPVDETPHGTGEHFRGCLGVPLFQAPPPPGLTGGSMAEAYFGEFASTFGPLGVDADFYSMSALYRSGRLDATIDAYLRAAPKVREVYRRETGSVRPPDWLPFQPICEACGRIGTTYASDYDGETVAYECRTDLVVWAEGCGAAGRRSPFGGSGKLPWKLEWAAKWKVFGVSLEGGGKDHMGAGGSHKVAAALAREVLDCDVPASFGYEFFTLAGAKMSSSKGIGATARELVDLLPAELLRYLVLRVQPRKAVDFALDTAGVTRAFSEYEKLWRTLPDRGPAQRLLFALSQPDAEADAAPAPGYSPPFDTLVSVVQQPHIDLDEHLERLGRTSLSNVEREWIERKRRTAESWSSRFSELAARLTVTEDFARAARRLTNHQRSFLSVSSRLLERLPAWNAADIQGALFDAVRIVGIDPAEAFAAFYELFFGGPEGPRAGSFLEFFGRRDACCRLGAVTYSYRALAEATAMPRHRWERAVSEAVSGGRSVSFLPVWAGAAADERSESDGAPGPVDAGATSGSIPVGCRSESDGAPGPVDGLGVVEFFFSDTKNRTGAERTILEVAGGRGAQDRDPVRSFRRGARSYLAGLLGVPEADVCIRSDSPFGTLDGRGVVA